MILIRGIKEEKYARTINNGIVGCRDVLSALLDPPITGYKYSNYYEKNLVKALLFFYPDCGDNIHDTNFLYSLLADYLISHLYASFFHILNNNSLEWLDSFDDDFHFISLNVKLDRITNTAIGKEYYGSKVTYVESIKSIDQKKVLGFQPACMCSIEDLFDNKTDMSLPLQIINTLSVPLLCREQTDYFTDIENEFRIIAYDCPRMKDGYLNQVPRTVSINGKSGNKYTGILLPGTNSVLKSKYNILRSSDISLKEIITLEKGMITLDSAFKSINIREISDGYQYLGNKDECRKYIKKMINNIPEDVFVDRTVLKTYKIEDGQSALFVPSRRIADY